MSSTKGMDKEGNTTRKRFYPLLLVFMIFLLPETFQAGEKLFSYQFADAREGAKALLSNETYIRTFNQNDLDFRLQKKEGTTEEWKCFYGRIMRKSIIWGFSFLLMSCFTV